MTKPRREAGEWEVEEKDGEQGGLTDVPFEGAGPCDIVVNQDGPKTPKPGMCLEWEAKPSFRAYPRPKHRAQPAQLTFLCALALLGLPATPSRPSCRQVPETKKMRDRSMSLQI